MVPQLATLAKRFELANASVNVDQMLQQSALASALQPVIGRVRTLVEALGTPCCSRVAAPVTRRPRCTLS